MEGRSNGRKTGLTELSTIPNDDLFPKESTEFQTFRFVILYSWFRRIGNLSPLNSKRVVVCSIDATGVFSSPSLGFFEGEEPNIDAVRVFF